LSLKAFADDNIVEVYTFKRDRVDQELNGNRGYISGKAPDVQGKPRETQRTLIAVDIQVGVGKDEDADVRKKTEKKAKPEKVSKPAKKAKPEKASKPAKKKTTRVEKKKKTKTKSKAAPAKKKTTVRELPSKPGAKNKVLIVEESEEEWIK